MRIDSARMVVPVLLVALGGCSKLHFNAETKSRYEMLVHVTTDGTRPVEAAQLQYSDLKLGVTGADGTAKISFVGNEGESYDVHVSCPVGLTSPPKPVQVTLRKMTNASKLPELTARCPPSTQVTVVAVRAENGANLPVLYLGKEIGRTDAAGAASVAMRLAPNEAFQLQLGTDEKGSERLLPKNPQASFSVKDHDQVVAFDQKFTLLPAKRVFVGRKVGPRPL